ncbi:aldehyde dehydrogenase family protein [Shinella curvata]|uniref:Aldehyde dehydrogenase family protein n=1 Tax=Shinella curvata TaxID=1817964 RepID=A0ABT8XLE8_9HYPH|nr:aldehyde dehydrogenase family protein [Shinella curvata]MCJ8056637.1 aldehyde dehydrogenase family protein [Shinella curvata]MDO6124523.1 aldehyde dehydrogenase family protein [Shinella curvata]
MTTEALVAEYFSSGTLAGLPSGHFIDGGFVAASGGRMMETFDPGASRAYHSFAAGNGDDVDRAVAAARRAGREWGWTKAGARGAILFRAAQIIRAEAGRLAVVESLDSGKTLQEAEGDVAGAVRCFEYYAGAADKIQGDTFPIGADYIGYSIEEPVGVTAHVIPWNYPLSTAARSIAPALAAGCTVVAKPAEQTPLTALMLADILLRAGLPAGVCNVITGTGAEAGGPLVAHPDVRHVTFTGSVATGIRVMQSAAANVASVVLELGGKSPLIVMADADMDAAVEGVLGAIYENAGQICSAGSRLVVERKIHAEMVERLSARAGSLRLGHGLRRPEVGALSSAAHLVKIEGYIEGARTRGIAIAAGGSRASDPENGKGWFFQPTILDAVSADDPVVQEEIFGPVLSVQVVEDEEEAVAVANGTDFGLVAGIYTGDFGRAHRMARDIDAGQVYINEYFAGGIEVPFGGNKLSGFGREKGFQALRSYTRTKSLTAKIS